MRNVYLSVTISYNNLLIRITEIQREILELKSNIYTELKVSPVQTKFGKLVGMPKLKKLRVNNIQNCNDWIRAKNVIKFFGLN